MSLLPWSSLLVQAASLGVGPQAFWQMSVCEWCALTGTAAGRSPSLTRTDLDHLSQAFPDEEIPSDDINEQ